MEKKGLGVANAPATLAPTGVAGATARSEAAPKDRGFLGNIAHGDFVSGIGRGDANSWIPLLTGLGTFATTPTRSVLGGALAGIGAGAQAAQAQREYGRQLRETGALEKTAGAQVTSSRTARLAELRAELQQAIENRFIDPAAEQLILTKRQEIADLLRGENPISQVDSAALPGATAPAAVALPGATAPAPEKAQDDISLARDIILHPSNHTLQEIQDLIPRLGANPIAAPLQNIITNAISGGKRIVGNDIQNVGIGAESERTIAQGSTAQAVQTQDNLDDAVQASANSLPRLQDLERSAKELEATNWKSSPITQRLAPYATSLNAIAHIFNFGDVIKPDAIGSIEEINKASATLAANLASSFRGTAGAEVLAQLGTTVPTSDLSPQGIRRLLGVVRQAIMANRDQKTFMDNYVAQNGGDPAKLRQAFTQYNASRPEGYWSQRAKIDYELSENKLTPQQKSAISAARGNLNFKPDGKHTLRQFLEQGFGKGNAEAVIAVMQSRGEI